MLERLHLTAAAQALALTAAAQALTLTAAAQALTLTAAAQGLTLVLCCRSDKNKLVKIKNEFRNLQDNSKVKVNPGPR